MRAAVVFEKTTGSINIIPAGTTCSQGSVIIDNASWTVDTTNAYRIHKGILGSNGFENGQTWTLNAIAPDGVTCKVHMIGISSTTGLYTSVCYGTIPASGTATLPYTFTIAGIPAADAACALMVEFAHGDTWGSSEEIAPGDVSNVTLTYGDGSTPRTTEICALHPGEISENAILAKAKNSKSNINLTVYPTMEAWGFCERSITYATVYDLDRTEDRIIFYGRVTGVKSSLTDKYAQDITIASAIDLLEDTSTVPMQYSSDYRLSAWLAVQIAHHNESVDTARQITLNADIAQDIYIQAPNKIVGSVYEALAEAVEGSRLFYYNAGVRRYDSITLEYRERYEDGAVYLDVTAKFGSESDTAIVIGENLREIAVEKSIDSGIYSSVQVVSGVNSDGTRGTSTATDSRMISLYGEGRTKVISADNIYCSAPMTEYDPDTGLWHNTQDFYDYRERLGRCARQEARKLSDPPVKITLAAEDLAAMGYTGYEPFELYNSYPVVCPKIGLYGERLRITQIRRRLCDGHIESMTIECGQQLLNTASSAPSSQQAARTQTWTQRTVSEQAEKQAEVTQSAVTNATDGAQIKLFDKASYDQLNHKNPDTIYVVKDNGVNTLYIGDDHIESGGGGGTIENGIILTNEQNTEWAPNHEVVPVDFRGGCSMWYGGMPARIVVQGLRVLVQVAEADILPDDLMTELTLTDCLGVTITYKCIITSMQPSAGYVKIRYYRNGQMLGETSTFSIGSSAGYTSKTFGMVLLAGSWTLYNDLLYPSLDMAFCVIRDGVPSRTTAFGLPGGYLTNPVTCSNAERGFGTAMIRKTEPVS